jgi:hypothetical protein
MLAEHEHEQAYARGLALRERLFELRERGTLDAIAALREEIEQLDLPALTQVDGLALSCCPSARFQQLRFIEFAAIDPELRPLFAAANEASPHLAAVFVDPAELSYRNFENIIELDHRFVNIVRERVDFGELEPLADGIYRAPLRASAHVQQQLVGLDALGLYTPPLTPRSRGGRRLIFHSEALGQALTRALREVLPRALLDGFVHVNPVFRCNRFDPGDMRFLPHVDSPYVDPGRRHISKYSLLLYLEGGRGDAALRFGDRLCLDEIEAMTAILFDASLAHDGGPFTDGAKLFLRSELIYFDPELRHSQQLSRTFARACYLTAHSVLEPELERHAHAAYEVAASARWQAGPRSTETEVFLHKHFAGVEFIANGYDYWLRRGVVSLPEAALLALFDVVNAKLGDTTFHQLCGLQSFERRFDADTLAWIAERLHASSAPGKPLFAILDKAALFPPLEQPNRAHRDEVYGRMTEFVFRDFAEGWDARRDRSIIEWIERHRSQTEPLIARAPVLLMGQERFIDLGRFVVDGDKLHILSSERLAPVHFAGGFNSYDQSSFTSVAATVDAPELLVPPIIWREHGELLHLRFDLFRNGAQVHYASRRLELLEPIGPDQSPRALD